MALFHKATLTPSKAEMLAAWVPTQSWGHDPDAPVDVIGAFRFDDPEARVGMETHLVTSGDTVLQVPFTYRDAPLDGADDALVGEMHHSALGTRWVYDGLSDPTYIRMLAAVTMTGQGEALGMVLNDGEWFIAPTNVRIRGGGWSGERVSVDRMERDGSGDDPAVFQNERFELIAYRHPPAAGQEGMVLTAIWPGQDEAVALAEVRER